MYCLAGQSSEEEMYNNEAAGAALEEFLQLLGERVRLKGFSKYRAQLDTKSEWCEKSEVTSITPALISFPRNSTPRRFISENPSHTYLIFH